MIAEGVSLQDRIIPILSEKAAHRKAKGQPPPDGWWYFVKAIRDESRKPKKPPDPVQWVAVGPQFDAANKVLTSMGEKPKSPMHINSKLEAGAYFPVADALSDRLLGALAKRVGEG